MVETARATRRVSAFRSLSWSMLRAGSHRVPQAGGATLVSTLDAPRGRVGDFSNPIFQFDYTLMVPASSAIAKVTDVDQPGVRIAAGTQSRFYQRVRPPSEAGPNSSTPKRQNKHSRCCAMARRTQWPRHAPISSCYRRNSPEREILVDRYGAMLNRIVVA